jgi:arylsulfatase A-like enzyme
VFPTLGKLCDIPPPATSEGREFTATLADPSRPARPDLQFGYRTVQKAYTDGRWKLIRYPQVDRTQLFDLQVDPQETKDLAADPAYASRLKELLGRLEETMAAFGDRDPLTAKVVRPAEWTPPRKGAKVEEK